MRSTAALASAFDEVAQVRYSRSGTTAGPRRANHDFDDTGNSDSVRNRALRNAQKTANMNELVQNLKRVKSLRFNNPVFAPPNDYVVSEGSLAITLDHQPIGVARDEQPSKQAA